MSVPKQLTAKLKQLARQVDLKRFQTNPWTPKKPPPKRISGNRGNHVSTHALLLEREQKKPKCAKKAQT